MTVKTILNPLTTSLIVAIVLAHPQQIHIVEKTLTTNYIPKPVKALIFEYAARNTNPGTLRLVCKNWKGIIDGNDTRTKGKETGYNDAGTLWKRCVNAWYGMTAHEEILERFLKGKLIYRPIERSDLGMIVLNISDLKNPFADTFDLSKCGNTGEHLSISTGFRTRKNPKNADKIEIRISLRSMMEKSGGFKGILKNGNEETAPFILLWNWGGWDVLTWYDYLSDKSPGFISTYDLYENWEKCSTDCLVISGVGWTKSFRFIL